MLHIENWPWPIDLILWRFDLLGMKWCISRKVQKKPSILPEGLIAFVT